MIKFILKYSSQNLDLFESGESWMVKYKNRKELSVKYFETVYDRLLSNVYNLDILISNRPILTVLQVHLPSNQISYKI